jgi:hypothetical protein
MIHPVAIEKPQERTALYGGALPALTVGIVYAIAPSLLL